MRVERKQRLLAIEGESRLESLRRFSVEDYGWLLVNALGLRVISAIKVAAFWKYLFVSYPCNYVLLGKDAQMNSHQF